MTQATTIAPARTRDPFEPLTPIEVSFTMTVSAATRRGALYEHSRTVAQRRELMRELIREFHLAEEIAPMPGEGQRQITYANWWKAIYQPRGSYA